MAAVLSAQRCPWPGHVQPAVHYARHNNGVLRRHADSDWHRKLYGTADDRRPRYGVPAAQRLRILGHAVWWRAGIFELYHGRRACDRLVRVCTPHLDYFFPRRCDRFLGAGADREWNRHDQRRREFCCYDSRHACARDDVTQTAVLRMDDAVDVVPDIVGDSTTHRLADHDLVRSATRRAFFRRRQW